MILCSGVFDGLHAGHVAYLEGAAKLTREGERLVVAIATDEYVRSVKGHEPKWPDFDRLAVVNALQMVDAVILHDEHGAASAIRLMKPRLFVKGADWLGKLPTLDTLACDAVGASCHFIAEAPVRHTSGAIL